MTLSEQTSLSIARATARVQQQIKEAAELLKQIQADTRWAESVAGAAKRLADCFKAKGKVIAAGNGGSHCDAMHFAEELTGRYRENRQPFPAIAISDPAYLSCVSNDFGYNQVFSRFIEAFGHPGDIFFGLSTSGSSENLVEAVKKARVREMQIILLLGNGGGKLKGQADVELIVPHQGYSDRIQEIHIQMIHIMIHLVECEFGFAVDQPTFL